MQRLNIYLFVDECLQRIFSTRDHRGAMSTSHLADLVNNPPSEELVIKLPVHNTPPLYTSELGICSYFIFRLIYNILSNLYFIFFKANKLYIYKKKKSFSYSYKMKYEHLFRA